MGPSSKKRNPFFTIYVRVAPVYDFKTNHASKGMTTQKLDIQLNEQLFVGSSPGKGLHLPSQYAEKIHGYFFAEKDPATGGYRLFYYDTSTAGTKLRHYTADIGLQKRGWSLEKYDLLFFGKPGQRYGAAVRIDAIKHVWDDQKTDPEIVEKHQENSPTGCSVTMLIHTKKGEQSQHLNGNVITKPVDETHSVTLGRNPNNDIKLDNIAVSGKHGVLVWENHKLIYRDVGSTNGTWYHETRIKDWEVHPQDHLEFSNTHEAGIKILKIEYTHS